MTSLLLVAALLVAPVDLRPSDPFADPDAALSLRVQAPTPPVASRWEWTTGDTLREVAVLALIAADWSQTRQFRAEGRRETNPILGQYPSRARVNFLIGSAMLGHPVVARLLPKPWRQAFQYGTIIGEAYAVGCNLDLGYVPFRQ